jgi:Ni,Fe-hydrogenase maturation factor
MKLLVIGCGNEVKGDDNLGPFIVRELERELGAHSEEIEFMVLPRLDISLAPSFRKVRAAVFVNARVDEDQSPVIVEPVSPAPYAAKRGGTGLGSTIADLMQAVKTWYQVCPLCYAVLPKGYEFSEGAPLSSGGRMSAGLARRSVLDLLNRLGNLQL